MNGLFNFYILEIVMTSEVNKSEFDAYEYLINFQTFENYQTFIEFLSPIAPKKEDILFERNFSFGSSHITQLFSEESRETYKKKLTKAQLIVVEEALKKKLSITKEEDIADLHNLIIMAQNKLPKAAKTMCRWGQTIKALSNSAEFDPFAFKIFSKICRLWKEQSTFSTCPDPQAISEGWVNLMGSTFVKEITPFFQAVVSSKLSKESKTAMRNSFKKNVIFEEGAFVIEEVGPEIIQNTFLTFTNRLLRLEFVKQLASLRKKLHNLKKKVDNGELSELSDLYDVQGKIRELKLENRQFLKENDAIVKYIELYKKCSNDQSPPCLVFLRKEFTPIKHDPLEKWSFPYNPTFTMALLYGRATASEMCNKYEAFASAIKPYRHNLSLLLNQAVKDHEKIKEEQTQIEKIKKEHHQTIELIEKVCDRYNSLYKNKECKKSLEENPIFTLDSHYYNLALMYFECWNDPKDTADI